MTPHERGQWLLLLHVYLLGQRAHKPDAFADQPSLMVINGLLWLAYWDAAGLSDTEEANTDDDFRHWVLTLWPSPPMA